MLLSLNWLKEYVDIKESPEEMALALTMHSAEVEEIKPQAELLDNVVAGRIKKIRKHPNADKLQLVDTEIDEGIVQIVCGGTNLKEGLWVAVAKVGAKVRWHGEGDPVVLEKVKLRGEESNGMICLDSEIGLGDNVGTEIMNLEDYTDKKIIVGQSLAELLELDDYIIDIDNKSLTHRSDLFSHIGIAREYAAIKDRKLKLPENVNIKGEEKYKLNIEVENFADTPRYMSIVLDNIEIKPSPEWMQKRLIAVGMRPINNVVDITNYVMLEFGHPVHAFDYNKIAGSTFKIRRARKGESMNTLDGECRELDGSMLVIEDDEKITDLAGIMGGESSEISNDTKTIAFEVADFNKTLIRKTANKLGLRTEAVVRYEKGLGLDLSGQTMARGIYLFEKYADAKVASKLYDVKEIKLEAKTIELDINYLNKVTGINITEEKAISILNALELKTQKNNDTIKVTVPIYRTDLNIPEDLIEEVARIYGYDNIPLSPLSGNLEPVEQLADLTWADFISQKLSGWGFNEVMNYSFYGDQEIEKCSLAIDDHIQIANPLSADQKYLRTTLLPGLLKNVSKNLDNKFNDLNLFEIGHLYYQDLELKMLAGIITGEKQDVFYKIKGAVEGLLKEMNIEYRIEELSKKNELENYYWHLFEPKADTAVIVNNKIVGTISLVNTKVLGKFDIEKQQVAFFNLNLNILSKLANTNRKYKPLSKYPEVDIDLSIILDEKYNWKEVEQKIVKTNKLIKSVELFDVYKGDKIESGKKSLAMHLIFQDESKTLKMKEVEKFRDDIMKELNNKFKAVIRDK